MSFDLKAEKESAFETLEVQAETNKCKYPISDRGNGREKPREAGILEGERGLSTSCRGFDPFSLEVKPGH